MEGDYGFIPAAFLIEPYDSEDAIEDISICLKINKIMIFDNVWNLLTDIKKHKVTTVICNSRQILLYEILLKSFRLIKKNQSAFDDTIYFLFHTINPINI